MGLRNAILVSLSIPLSMLIGFAILRMLDVTLNMVVLFSLTLSLGMLVDNAVVIIENIYRFMQQGVPRLEAAMRATSEVAYPIIGSGLTTIAAFFPLLFWTGIMGEFMVYLPTTVITVLGSCLFVALVINPAMAAVLMRKPPDAGATRSADEITSGEDHPMLHEGGIFIKLYRGTLRSALGMRLPAASEVEARWLPARAGRHVLRLLPRLSVLAVALVVFVVAIMTWMYVVALRTPTQFFPEPDPDSAEVSLEVPEGASLEYCDGLVRRVEKRVYDADARHDTPFAKARRLKGHRMKGAETYKSPSDIANVEHSWARVDALQYNNSVSFLFPDFEDRTESSKETIKTIESRLTTFAGAKLTVQEPERGPPTGAPINIEIIGDDLDTLGRIATEVSEKVQKVAFVRNVRDNYQAGAPTLQIRIDRKRAAYLGLGVQSVGNAIRTAISGVDISSYREGDEDYDIVVRLGEAARREITTLRRLAIHSQTHGAVPLTTIAEIRYVGGLGEIHRIDHDRVVTVQADVDTTKTTGTTAKQQAEQLLAGSPLFEAKGIFAVEDGAERFNAVTLPAAVENAFAAIADRAALEAETGEDADHAPLAKALNAIVRSFDPDAYPEATKQLLDPGRAGAPDGPDVGEKVREVKGYLAAADPAPATRQRRNRLLVELAYGEVLQEADEGLELPPGYRYRFTGEDEHQREAGQFLSWAGMVALGLIFLILVAQFDSIIFPFIILSSVILSLTGVFFGLAIYQLPFVIIMTGVGVISLAGVVVNNAIVLIDYSRQLIDRGLERDTALLAAGATRLRPVILTAITTCLGLVPMITGYSVDFHPILEGAMPIFQAASQSSQWWQAMAVAVVFGILVATALTLFVVPVLFSLLDDLRHITLRSARSTGEHAGRMHRLYWRVFTRLTGIQPRPGDPGQEGSGA
jgi:multidrug efflux pump subunit AcrB